MCEYIDGMNNVVDPRCGIWHLMLNQIVQNALKVAKYSGMSSTWATLAASFLCRWGWRRIACGAFQQIAPHISPRDGFARSDEPIETRISGTGELGAPFFHFRLFDDGFQHKILRRLAGLLGRRRDARLELFR